MKKENFHERAVKFIYTSRDDELSGLKLGKVAKAIGTNSSNLCDIFMIKHKMSFAGFLKREIIYRAAYTLRKNRDISIEDLAYRLGFPTVGAFEKEFSTLWFIKPDGFREIEERKSPRGELCAIGSR